jgi:glycosyltransferase involved in cell wall biosynthesis
MRFPKISVVTCSFNHARFLEQTIRSVLDQEYPNLEYIIIDGGSTDASVDIIRRYENRLAYWVSERDQGQTDGLIKGFSRVTGDISCWLCSDDLHEPWTLREVADFFAKTPQARVVYGDSTWIDARGAVISRIKEHGFNRFIWKYSHDYIPQPSTFWRHDLYIESGGLNREFECAMDGDLWARFSRLTKIYHVGRPWSQMRYYPEQKVQLLEERCRKEDRMIRERYLGSRPDWIYQVSYFTAKGLRIPLKFFTGKYF